MHALVQMQGPSFYAHNLVDDFLASQPQQVGGNLPSGYQSPCKLSSTQPPPPDLLKLAVLLLGYGRQHAVQWAQQLLEVEPVDATPLPYLGGLSKWAAKGSNAGFAWEPTGQLGTRLGMLLKGSGRYTQAEPFLRWAKPCVFCEGAAHCT